MEEKQLPVMIAGSIQLAGQSQFRLLVVAVLDVGALEGEEALGSPPKLMFMLGRRALRPSCHSFIFILSIELLWSERFIQNEKKKKKKKVSINIFDLRMRFKCIPFKFCNRLQ